MLSYDVGVESFQAIGGALTPTTAVLDPTKTNQITLYANNSFQTEFTHIIGGGPAANILFASGSNGSYLLKGQDPDVIFGAGTDLAAHFNFLIPLLDPDWSYVATERYTSFITTAGLFVASITTYGPFLQPYPCSLLHWFF